MVELMLSTRKCKSSAKLDFDYGFIFDESITERLITRARDRIYPSWVRRARVF